MNVTEEAPELPGLLPVLSTLPAVRATPVSQQRGQQCRRSQTTRCAPEHVVVTYTDIASNRRAAAEAAYVAEVLPELADWLVSAAAAPEGWRILNHGRTWTWTDAGVECSGDDFP